MCVWASKLCIAGSSSNGIGESSQNDSQGISVGSFSALLGSAFKIVIRTLLDAYFEHFYVLLPNSFQEALKYVVLRGVLRPRT